MRTFIVLLALGATGCATVKPLTPKATEPQATPPRTMWTGRVLKADAERRYVIVECALLPRAGEEATVFREETRVGRIRFARQISFPYAAADILEGVIAPGDRVRK